MKVLDRKDVEECLDGVIIKEFLLDGKISEKFIYYMGRSGELKYFPHFPRPFFKITKKSEFIIKGVEGNNTFQVFFINHSSELENAIIDMVGSFHT